MIHKLLSRLPFLFSLGFASGPVGGGGGGGTPPSAPTAPAVSSPAPTPSPSSSPSPVAAPVASPATPAPVIPGAPSASPTVPSPTNPNDANIEVLRRSHETLQSLGDLNEVRGGLGVYQTIWSEARTLAQKLEYTEESLQRAFKLDPVGIITQLRQEARTQAADPQYQRQQADDQRVRDMVRRETQPLTEAYARQMADRHNATVDSEFNRMLGATDAFKPRNGVPLPAEMQSIVRDRFIETVKWDNAVLQEVMQGKTSGLQKIFDAVSADVIKGWTAYNSWGNGTPIPGGSGPLASVIPGGPPRAPNGQFVGTLDDIIEGNDKANVLPSMRGFK